MSDFFFGILFSLIAYASGFCCGRAYEIWKAIRHTRRIHKENDAMWAKYTEELSKRNGEDGDQISTVE